MKKSFILPASIIIAAAMTSCSQSAKTAAEQTDSIAAEQLVEVAEVEDAVLTLTDSDAIAANPEQPIIIDFSATWCGPCQQLKPIFHKVAKKYAGRVQFATVDVDDSPEMARMFGVQTIPQLTLIKRDGTKVTSVGLMTEDELSAIIETALSED